MRIKPVAVTVVVFLFCFPVSGRAKTFSGADAMAWTKRAVDLGPRPDGSPAIAKLRTILKTELASRGCEVISDKFTADSPDGPVPMENIIAKFPGKSGRAIAVT